MLKGKGIYIWRVKECENGVISDIVIMAQNANFSHVIIKIADGTVGYNFPAEGEFAGRDLAKELADALKAVGIEAWGYQYIYGRDPVGEAKTVTRRIKETGCVGFVIDAEGEIRDVANNDLIINEYFNNLDDKIWEEIPIALASYRCPEVHPKFPWDAFIAHLNNDGDFMMPQLYWMKAHNPIDQLTECIRQYAKITDLPIVPTGSAFCEHGWCPTNAEIKEFASEAKAQGLAGINFWEWAATRRDGFWKTVRDVEYTVKPELPEEDCCEGLRTDIWQLERWQVEMPTPSFLYGELDKIADNAAEIESLKQNSNSFAEMIADNRTSIDNNTAKVEGLWEKGNNQDILINKLVNDTEANTAKNEKLEIAVLVIGDDHQVMNNRMAVIEKNVEQLTLGLEVLRTREIEHTREHNESIGLINSAIELINTNAGVLQERLTLNEVNIHNNYIACNEQIADMQLLIDNLPSNGGTGEINKSLWDIINGWFR